jgi:hypothetical protein
MARRFQVFSGNPSDPSIEYVTAYSFELDHLGNLKFKAEYDKEAPLICKEAPLICISVYAAGSWYKVKKEE